MARPGLRNCDVFYEARRGKRQRTEHPGEELKLKLSDYAHLIQKISCSENTDEDYVAFLKLSYKYDKISESYTNEHGNGDSYDEVENEDEADMHYKTFLANAKRDGRSYVLNVDTKAEFPLFLKYEKECDYNYGFKRLCRLKQKDIEMQKDAVDEESFPNTCSKDELKNWRFPRNDSNRSIGGMDVVFEPSNPTSLRNNRIMSRKVGPEKHGAPKRQGKREAKIKSHEEKMMGKGSEPVHVGGKEKTSDVDEDYICILENLQCENWGMKASSRSGCNTEFEATEDDLEILYDSSDMLKKDKYPQSQFKQKVMDLLLKPYNQKEYKELWTFVNEQKPVERNMESRRGGVNSYKTNKMGKSYLDHYNDLKEKLKEVDNDERKKLKILRGFSFWLQNLTNKGAFRPWNDTQFLARVAESC
ncbi:unnamed protein product [Withania somnifera]